MYELIKGLALPPANLLVVIIIGLWLARRRRRLGLALVTAACVTLYLLSTGLVANRLLALLESGIETPAANAAPPQAIAILSAGYLDLTPQGSAVDIDAMTLDRLRFGARLHRETGLPILVTGGGPDEERPPMATLMQQSLERDFCVAANWVESRSLTTQENAAFSARILSPLDIRSVYVVTQGWHLPRALAAFRAAGFTAWPAAAGYTNLHDGAIKTDILMPSAKSLHRSFYAFHEWLGLIWYRAFHFT